MSAQNSKKTTKKTIGKPFEPGKSGNPGGRPKIPDDIKEALKGYTADAVSALAHLVKNGKTEVVRLQAANSILDRVYGKPTQPLAGDSAADPLGMKITVEVIE